MILGQIFGYDGIISFQNHSIKSMSKHQIQDMRRKIACVFQDYKLVSYHDIQDNVTLPLRINNLGTQEIQDRYDHVCQTL